MPNIQVEKTINFVFKVGLALFVMRWLLLAGWLNYDLHACLVGLYIYAIFEAFMTTISLAARLIVGFFPNRKEITKEELTAVSKLKFPAWLRIGGQVAMLGLITYAKEWALLVLMAYTVISWYWIVASDTRKVNV